MTTLIPQHVKDAWKYNNVQVVMIVCGGFLLFLFGFALLWDTRTIDAPVTQDAYSCKGQEEIIPMTQHPEDYTLKGAKARGLKSPLPLPPVFSDSPFIGEVGGVVVTLTINPSSPYHNGFAITGGQLIKGGRAIGTFSVADPGPKRAIRLTPSEAHVNATAETELRLCLERQS